MELLCFVFATLEEMKFRNDDSMSWLELGELGYLQAFLRSIQSPNVRPNSVKLSEKLQVGTSVLDQVAREFSNELFRLSRTRAASY